MTVELPRSPSFALDGRRALVVGASSGIGLGAAMAVAEAGAEVVLAARAVGKLAEVAEAMQGLGLKARALRMDVMDVADFSAAIAAEGPFDILVNSAGIARHGPALDTTVGDFDFSAAVNLRGSYFLAQSVAKSLIAAGKPGSIITISSQMAHVGGIDRAVYAAMKHGIEGMTKSMAIEWGPHGIRVNTICPTFIRTALTESTFADPERRGWVEGKIKLGRVGRVEDIMGAVAYLASDAAALVTGTSLMVDGGWTAD
jgi:NAD(P)-dependent dehydrogenase (short-subunit alcohol dehydrogenase family)